MNEEKYSWFLLGLCLGLLILLIITNVPEALPFWALLFFKSLVGLR